MRPFRAIMKLSLRIPLGLWIDIATIEYVHNLIMGLLFI